MPGECSWKLLLGRHIERNGERNDEHCKQQPSTHGFPPTRLNFWARWAKPSHKGVSSFYAQAATMSALGQKRTFAAQNDMSALSPKADISFQLSAMGRRDGA